MPRLLRGEGQRLQQKTRRWVRPARCVALCAVTCLRLALLRYCVCVCGCSSPASNSNRGARRVTRIALGIPLCDLQKKSGWIVACACPPNEFCASKWFGLFSAPSPMELHMQVLLQASTGVSAFWLPCSSPLLGSHKLIRVQAPKRPCELVRAWASTNCATAKAKQDGHHNTDGKR